MLRDDMFVIIIIKIIIKCHLHTIGTWERPPTYSQRGMFLARPNVSSERPPASSSGRNMEVRPL